MRCICGDEFIRNEGIHEDYDRCPNCDRNIYDIKLAEYTKRLEICLNDFLFDLETYGTGFIFTNINHYKLTFEKRLNEK